MTELKTKLMQIDGGRFSKILSAYEFDECCERCSLLNSNKKDSFKCGVIGTCPGASLSSELWKYLNRKLKENRYEWPSERKNTMETHIEDCMKGAGWDDSSTFVNEQQAPTKNDLPAVWDLVIKDMNNRDKEGTRKYGTRLQPSNGRDVLIDVYQELLDAVVYMRQFIFERDGK